MFVWKKIFHHRLYPFPKSSRKEPQEYIQNMEQFGLLIRIEDVVLVVHWLAVPVSLLEWSTQKANDLYKDHLDGWLITILGWLWLRAHHDKSSFVLFWWPLDGWSLLIMDWTCQKKLHSSVSFPDGLSFAKMLTAKLVSVCRASTRFNNFFKLYQMKKTQRWIFPPAGNICVPGHPRKPGRHGWLEVLWSKSYFLKSLNKEDHGHL